MRLSLVPFTVLALLAACQSSPRPDLKPSAAATVTVRAQVAASTDPAPVPVGRLAAGFRADA